MKPIEKRMDENGKRLTPADWTKNTQTLIKLCTQVEKSKNGETQKEKK